MKRIVLCADDYGQAPTVSQGIIDLLELGRLSAVSCMVNSPFWPVHATWLLPFQHAIDIGLHLNLTEGKPLSKPFIEAYGESLFSLSALMYRGLVRQLNKDILEAECLAQIDQFVEMRGCLPAFVDGHQHIHQFPVIREALISAYNKRLRAERVYLRLVNEKIKWIDVKKRIIQGMGTKRFQSLLNKNDIPYNQSFAGIYSLSPRVHYATLFPRFLNEIKDQGLIMCHPGLPTSSALDLISEARYNEYQYFISSQFLEACRKENVVLSRGTFIA